MLNLHLCFPGTPWRSTSYHSGDDQHHPEARTTFFPSQVDIVFNWFNKISVSNQYRTPAGCQCA